jgi:hypothetical protein
MNLASLSGLTKVVATLGVGGVLAGAIALGASGGKGAGSAPPAQVVAAAAANVPEGTTQTVQAGVTPRTDCAKDWLPYEDPDGWFSFCYPADLKLVTSIIGDKKDYGVLVSVYPPGPHPEGSFGVTFVWRSVGNSVLSAENLCTGGGPEASYTSANLSSRLLSNKNEAMCITDSFSDSGKTDHRFRTLISEPKTSTDGVISARGDFGGEDFSALEAKSLAILDTLRIR